MRAALALIEEEGVALLRDVARCEPAKVVAQRAGITRRHVYNLRNEECQPSWLPFIALAQQYPELRAAVARWLGLADKSDPKAQELIEQIRRMVEAQPEEGDRG